MKLTMRATGMLSVAAIAFLTTVHENNTVFAQGTGYGVAGGDLYSIDLSNGSSSLITSSLAFANTNGLATDGDNDILYYSQHDSYNIGYYDLNTSATGVVGNLASFNSNLANALGVRGAGWFNGGYYFLDITTDDLYRADLSTSGISSVIKVADISNDLVQFTMGDLVIDQSGLLTASFFDSFQLATYDLHGGVFTTYAGSVPGVNGGLSLGNDGHLYGTSGATTDLTRVLFAGGTASGSVIGSSVPLNMKDISSDVGATATVPEPGSLIVLAACALAVTCRRRR